MIRAPGAPQLFVPRSDDPPADFGRAFHPFGRDAQWLLGILKVARTIADLAGGGDAAIVHVSEDVGYRVLDRRQSLVVSVQGETDGKTYANRTSGCFSSSDVEGRPAYSGQTRMNGGVWRCSPRLYAFRQRLDFGFFVFLPRD